MVDANISPTTLASYPPAILQPFIRSIANSRMKMDNASLSGLTYYQVSDTYQSHQQQWYRQMTIPSLYTGPMEHTLAMPDLRCEKRRPKYTRSRTGCLVCRQKKVKCDEAKPSCGRCIQSERECSWPDAVDILRDRESTCQRKLRKLRVREEQDNVPVVPPIKFIHSAGPVLSRTRPTQDVPAAAAIPPSVSKNMSFPPNPATVFTHAHDLASIHDEPPVRRYSTYSETDTELSVSSSESDGSPNPDYPDPRVIYAYDSYAGITQNSEAYAVPAPEIQAPQAQISHYDYNELLIANSYPMVAPSPSPNSSSGSSSSSNPRHSTSTPAALVPTSYALQSKNNVLAGQWHEPIDSAPYTASANYCLNNVSCRSVESVPPYTPEQTYYVDAYVQQQQDALQYGDDEHWEPHLVRRDSVDMPFSNPFFSSTSHHPQVYPSYAADSARACEPVY